MRTVSLEELLEAGCHFGHQVTRQNPKARDFIFEARDNIHIIDLEKTKEGLEEAGQYVRDLAKKGGTLLVLGTKRQAENVLREELKRVKDANAGGIYYVTKRWIGGTLTNFPEVSKNYKKLKDLTERLQNDYEKARYTKKEIGDWEKERQKLVGFYGGTADMNRTPDALFIIDTHTEHVASKESMKVGIPTVGITDTNADPTIINYPIPANDDAVGSLKLIISYIFDAWIEGKQQYELGIKNQAAEEEKKLAKEKENQESKSKPAAGTQAAPSKPEKEDKTPVSKEAKAVKEKKPAKEKKITTKKVSDKKK